MTRISDLPDLNVWLALSASEHPYHPRAVEYWAEAADRRLAFCRVTALGFLRLLTNATVMGGRPLSARDAWTAYQTWLQVEDVVVAPEPEGCDAQIADWVERGMVTARLWTDAYLAAFAMTGGWRVVSFDRNFARFEGVDLLLLDDRPT